MTGIRILNAYGLPGYSPEAAPLFVVDVGPPQEAQIDGAPIGVFPVNGAGHCYIQAPVLTEGPHKLEWRPEGSSAAWSVFDFIVDSVRPFHPAITNVTKRADGSGYFDVTGRAAFNSHLALPVQIKEKLTASDTIGMLIGGGMADLDGSFHIACKPGKVSHKIVAVAVDKAGNFSKPSPAKALPKT